MSWFDFAGGPVEWFFAAVFVFVGVVTLFYSGFRIRGSAGQVVEYSVFLLLLVASALGVAFGQDLLLVFVFWEVAAFALWRLVVYHRGDEDVTAASWAWYVNFAAAGLMLVGLAMLYAQEGTLALGALEGAPMPVLAAVLVLLGILAKSATLPLYVWLPRAYRAAPVPVCALLSGVAESIGALLFLKLFVMTVLVPEGFLALVAWLGIASSIVAGGLALRSTTVRGLLAYSTISQLGFIFLGMAATGYYGLLGALLYVMAHAVAKAGLFFAAGLVEEAAGTGELSRLGGAARRFPVLAAAVALLAFSIVGMPPLLGFFAKLGVVLGALEWNLLLAIGAIVGALFTILYLLRFYTTVFLGSEVHESWKPVSNWLVAVVVVMALVSVAGGVLVSIPIRFLEPHVLALVEVF